MIWHNLFNQPKYSLCSANYIKKSSLTWFSTPTNVVAFRRDSVCMGMTLTRERLQLRWVMIFENWSFPVSTQIFQIIFLHELSQNVNHNWVNKWNQSKIHGRYRVLFLTGLPYFQYQNEKQVAANQDWFFTKFSMLLVGWASFFILVLKIGRTSQKNHPVREAIL